MHRLDKVLGEHLPAPEVDRMTSVPNLVVNGLVDLRRGRGEVAGPIERYR